MKKATVFTLYMIAAQSVSMAQSAAGPQNAVARLVTDSQTYLIIFIVSVLLATIIVLGRALNSLTNKMAPKPKRVETLTDISEKSDRETFWKWVNRKFINDAVPVEKEADVLLDHNYDGIRELDNNLPPWWKYGFYLTIVWALFYMVNYHVVGAGNVQEQEYAAQLKEAEAMKAERLKMAANAVDENTVTLLDDEKAIAEGGKLFNEKCMVCHGAGGEGTVGPNLTDDYWIHGGSINDVFKTIKYGVPAKGMLAWQGQITPVQMQMVASFVMTLHGTNPPNPKAPQGDLYVPVSESAVVTDSATVVSLVDSTLKSTQ